MDKGGFICFTQYDDIFIETNETATSGIIVTKSKFGRTIETESPAGKEYMFFDPYGRVFYTEKEVDGMRRSDTWIGRNDYGDFAENDTFYSSGDSVYTAGRRIGLSTTRDGTLYDATAWTYNPATSLCTAKTYADGSTVTYTHTPDGKPLRTTYASGRWRGNAYNTRRELTSTQYSDGGNDRFDYDVFGQTNLASNGVASVAYLRDPCGNCTNETIVIGAVTNAIERTSDAYGRLVRNSLCGSVSPCETTYTPDGRIDAISNGEAVVEYAYTPDRFESGYTLTLTNGTSFTRTLVRDAYRRSLVTSITNAVNDVPVGTLSYAYDALGRPVSRNSDTFGYNDRSEVTAAAIGGVASVYGYDEIGNSSSFTPNNLNQYTEFSYDLEGNLLTDGIHAFTYDAANRLKTASSNGLAIATFAYDAQGRRVRKIVSHGGVETRRIDYIWDGWLLVKEITTDLSTFQPFNYSTEYHWGKDLSGTFQGAGGVGGLLYLTVSNSPTPNSSTHPLYVPFYDNNGNITRYLDENGNTVAQYTYNVFGNTVSQSGPLAGFFRHRFSTKYFDSGTGLYYYGYRFYHPVLMRWLNRDPMEEDGGVNLYCFVQNASTFAYDAFGHRRSNLPGIIMDALCEDAYNFAKKFLHTPQELRAWD